MQESGKNHADYSSFSSLDRREALEELLLSYEALSQGQDNWVCNLANAASLMWHCYHTLGVNVNWAGFYVTKVDNDMELILGPFQGKVACQVIRFDKGVCGKAASSRKTQVVPDVNLFPGHIACDGQTRSEIVVPILQEGKCVGVIDIDCLDYDGFNDIDKKYLEELALKISSSCSFMTY